MKIILNEQNRKPLVKLVREFAGEKAKYLFTPTYAFQIGGYTVTREGNIDTPDGLDAGILRSLVDALTAAGYQPEMPDQEAAAETAEAEPENGVANEPAEAELQQATEESAADEIAEPESDGENEGTETAEPMQPISLTISVPLEKVNAGNLTSLLDAKGSLIKKALGIPATPIEITESEIIFPWFSTLPDADTSKAYTDFISALCAMSLNLKRVTAKEKEVDNEKYVFRCFLLRLGFIGPDFKTDRKILLKNLSGSSAFKSGSWNSTEGGEPHEEA